jgi:hypothetical protein
MSLFYQRWYVWSCLPREVWTVRKRCKSFFYQWWYVWSCLPREVWTDWYSTSINDGASDLAYRGKCNRPKIHQAKLLQEQACIKLLALSVSMRGPHGVACVDDGSVELYRAAILCVPIVCVCMCMCVCVCVFVIETERVCMHMWERESVCVCANIAFICITCDHLYLHLTNLCHTKYLGH